MAWLFSPKMKTALLLCFQELHLRDLDRGVDSLVLKIPLDIASLSAFSFSGLSSPRCLGSILSHITIKAIDYLLPHGPKFLLAK